MPGVEVRPQYAQGKSSAPYWGQANIYPAAARTLEAKSSGGWKAPFADYGFKGWQVKGLVHSSAGLHCIRDCRDRADNYRGMAYRENAGKEKKIKMPKNNNFIQRSIMGALSFLKESIFADEYALRPGFLQSLDPRIKSVTFLLFILQILFTKSHLGFIMPIRALPDLDPSFPD